MRRSNVFVDAVRGQRVMKNPIDPIVIDGWVGQSVLECATLGRGSHEFGYKTLFLSRIQRMVMMRTPSEECKPQKQSRKIAHSLLVRIEIGGG